MRQSIKKWANFRYSSLLLFIFCLIFSVIFELTIGNLHYYNNNFKGQLKINQIAYDQQKNDYVLVIKDSAKYIRELEFNVDIDSVNNVDFDTYYQDSKGKEWKINTEKLYSKYDGKVVIRVGKTTDQLRLVFHDTTDNYIKITNVVATNNFQINYLKIITMTVIIYLMLDFIKQLYQDHRLPLNKYFFKVAVMVGVLVAILTPLYYPLDEKDHYLRSYNIASGNWFQMAGDKIDYPVGLNDHLEYPNNIFIPNTYTAFVNNWRYLDKLSTTEVVKVDHHSTASPYLFPAYMVSGLGVYIAKICHLTFPVGFYLGRILNAIFYALIVSLAIKYGGKIGKFIFVVGLLPTTIFMGASFSADMFTNAFSLLAIGLTFYYREKRQKIGIGDMLVLLGVYTLSFISKIAYFPITLLILLIPKKQFKNEKSALFYKIGIPLIGFITFIIATLYANKAGIVQYPIGGVNEKGQLLYIVCHPFSYVYTLLHTCQVELMNYITNGFSQLGYCGHLGMLDLIVIMIVFVLLIGKHNDLDIKRGDRIILLLVILLCFGSSMSAMYLSFTPVGSSLIQGYQGRYLIPMVVPILVAITNRKFKADVSDNVLVAINIILVIHLLILLITKFYV